MKDQPFDELRQVFREAQADLPPGLEARLLAIPQTVPSTSLWDLRLVLPLLALVPGFLWVVNRYASDLMGYVTQLMRGLSLTVLPRIIALGDFTLPNLSQIPVVSELTLPTITPVMVLVFTAAVAVVAGLAAGLYLWRESQMDIQYIRQLNRAM
ncbi:MAG: hypothetical protein KAU50_03885 [Candidatus Marinimicrobia bacterium]|nr:hypothetical protein [Candidatus Neomarinimicrobiota bacterium]